MSWSTMKITCWSWYSPIWPEWSISWTKKLLISNGLFCFFNFFLFLMWEVQCVDLRGQILQWIYITALGHSAAGVSRGKALEFPGEEGNKENNQELGGCLLHNVEVWLSINTVEQGPLLFFSSKKVIFMDTNGCVTGFIPIFWKKRHRYVMLFV